MTKQLKTVLLVWNVISILLNGNINLGAVKFCVMVSTVGCIIVQLQSHCDSFSVRVPYDLLDGSHYFKFIQISQTYDYCFNHFSIFI